MPSTGWAPLDRPLSLLRNESETKEHNDDKQLRADLEREERQNAELTAEVLRLDAEIYRLKGIISQLRAANNYLADQVVDPDPENK